MFYTKLEFILGTDETENYRFRKAVSQLLDEFEDHLEGVGVQHIYTGWIYCEECEKEEALDAFDEVFREPVSTKDSTGKQS